MRAARPDAAGPVAVRSPASAAPSISGQMLKNVTDIGDDRAPAERAERTKESKDE